MGIDLSRAIATVGEAATRNELKWSNGFGNAWWIKATGVTYEAVPGAGPDGKLAWRINAPTPNATLQGPVTSAVVTAGDSWVGAVWLKGEGSDIGKQVRVGVRRYSGTLEQLHNTHTLTSEWVRVQRDITFAYNQSGVIFDIRTDSTANPAASFLVHMGKLEKGTVAGDDIETEQSPLDNNQVIARIVDDYNAIAYSNTPSDATWAKAGIASATDTLTLTDTRVLHKIKEDSSTGGHFIDQNSLSVDPAGLVTLRLTAASAVKDIGIAIYGDTTSNYFYYYFDQATGAVTASGVAGTGSLHSYSIEQVDTLTVDGTPSVPVWEIIVRGWPSTTSAATLSKLRISDISGGTSSSYTGNGSDGVYIGYMRMVQGYTISDSDAVTAGAAELPLAAAISEATVGGVACAVGGTNAMRNSAFSGAAVGTPGTLPTYWAYDASTTGISRQIVEVGVGADGRKYMDIRLYGTAAATSYVAIYPAGTTEIAALQGQTWTFQYAVQMIGGSMSGWTNTIRAAMNENTSGGSYLTGGSSAAVDLSDGEEHLNSYTRTLTNASTAVVFPYPALSTTSGAAVDVTLRLRNMNIEQAALIGIPIETVGTPIYGRTKINAVLQLPAFPFSEFDNAGDWRTANIAEALPVVVGDGSTEFEADAFTFARPSGVDYSVAGAGPYVFGPPGLSANDPTYGEVVSGAGSFDLATCNFTPSADSVVRIRAFDVSAGHWFDYVQKSVNDHPYYQHNVRWLPVTWYPWRSWGTDGEDPMSNVYPAVSIVPRRTYVTRKQTETFDVAIDGTVRIADASAQAAYSLRVVHDYITADHLAWMRAYFTAWAGRTILIVDAEGRTYSGPLPRDFDALDQVSSAYWKASVVLEANLVS